MNEMIMRLNLVKGIVSDHVPPEKLMKYLNGIEGMKTFYNQQTMNIHHHWLFYTLEQVKHFKKWCLALKSMFPQDYWESKNKKGNTLFLEAIERKHLKSALEMASFGVNINVRNHQGENFADLIYRYLNEKEHLKKKWFAYLLFINKMLENEYPISLDPENIDSIKKVLTLSKETLSRYKKESQYGYEQYWIDILEFVDSLNEKIEENNTQLRKRKLGELLIEKEKSDKVIKI